MVRATAVVVLTVLIAASCDSAPPPPEVDPEGEIRIVGFEPTPGHLDPQQASFTNEVGEVSLLFDTLLTYDRTGSKLVPALATDLPQVSADGLTYTATIREGLVYSDGKPLVADDFVFAFRHLCDPATASELAYSGYVVEGCERYHADADASAEQLGRDRDGVGVTAVDPRHVRFRLAAPATYFPYLLASWVTAPTREDAVAKGSGWTEAGSFVGNGLFTLARWAHRSEMVFERNELHRPRAKLKRIILDLSPGGPAAALAAYQHGALDSLDVPLELKTAVDRDPALTKQVVRMDSTCTTYFAFNVRRPPFDDATVRLAFAKSIDRDAWVNEQLQGLAVPTTTFVPPTIPGYDPDDDVQRFDPVAARALLRSSRYAETLPAVQLTYAAGATAKNALQTVVDAWRSSLGVAVALAPVDGTTLANISRQPALLPQLTLQSWCAAYPDPANYLSSVFTSRSTSGRTNYSNAEFDALIGRADTENEPSARTRLYREAQRMLTRDAPAAFVSVGRKMTLVSPRLHGVSLTPLDRAFSQFTLGDVYVAARPDAHP